MWKGAVVAQFEKPFQNLSGRFREHPPTKLIPRPRLKPITSWIQARSFTPRFIVLGYCSYEKVCHCHSKRRCCRYWDKTSGAPCGLRYFVETGRTGALLFK